MLAMAVAGVGHCALAAPHNNDFGEIINTGYAQGKNSLCALRDRYGFLWVGTLTGLYCFDGNGLQVFPHPSGSLRPPYGNMVRIYGSAPLRGFVCSTANQITPAISLIRRNMESELVRLCRKSWMQVTGIYGF